MTIVDERPPVGTEPSDESPRGAQQRARLGTYSAFAVATTIVLGLVGVPLVMLVYRTFTENGRLTFAGFERAYGDSAIGELIRNTLIFALGSTVLAMVLGSALAYIAVRTDAPFRRLLTLAAIVPLIIPTILYAPAWVFLASPNIGLFNSWSNSVIGVAPFNIYSVWGMIWVQGLHAVPLVFLFMSPAFRSADPAIEEAAVVAGVSRMRILWSLTLPLVRPALAASALITFVQALEVFEVPALIGLPHGIRVLSSQIYYLQNQFPVDDQGTGAIALSLFAVAAVGVFATTRMGGDIRRFGTISGKAYRPRIVPLGRSRIFVGAFGFLYFVVAVAMPVLVLIYSSLVRFYTPPTRETLQNLTMDNYSAVFHDPIALRSFKNTVLLGVSAATIVLILSLIVSYISIRTTIPGRRVLNALTFSPITIPGLVLGLAIAYVYLRLPIGIYGTLWILLIAYSTRFLPYAMRFVTAAMSSVSAEIEEAARVAGGSRLQIIRRIVLPLIGPSLLSAWIFILIMSFRELQASLLLYTPGKEVLAVLVFEQYNNGNTSILAAIGVVVMIVLITLASVAALLQKRSGIKVR